MVTPLVLPWVEQPHDLPGNRISSGDIRTFVPIAVQASQGGIFEAGQTLCCCAMM
jgi:hypothetical protein